MLSLALESLNSDIVCISEHWYTSEALAAVNVKGYTLQASYCRGERLHGGVAIYAKNGLSYKDANLERFSIPFHAEFAGIELTQLDCLVVVVYWSPSNGKFSVFTQQLENMLNVVFDRYGKIIILGDFNCDPERHPADAHILECIMTAYNLQRTIDGYTRITRSSRSSLDNIYINFAYDSYDASIYDPAISDHAGQIISINVGHSVTRAKYGVRRVVSAAGLADLKRVLSDFDWDGLSLKNLGGEQAMTVFVHFLGCCISDCGVVRLSRVREGGSLPVFWYTDELKTMRDTLQAIKTVCNVTGNISDWNIYRAHRNAYRKCIVKAKRSAYDNYIASAENRQKNCWKIINSERLGNKTTSNNKTNLTSDEFNLHFCQIVDKMLGDLPMLSSTDVKAIARIPVCSSTIFLNPVTPSELACVILSLKNKNSLDCYNINARVLKYVCEEIVHPLTTAINVCIAEGVFPDLLKVNKIVPIHKKGDSGDVGNYRPIAICPVVAKVFETLLKERLLNFFKTNQIVNPRQFGFRQGYSTIDAVLRLLDDVVQGFDNGCRTEVTLCDLTKAFDCVSSDVLLEKLYSCGIRGVCYRLLRSYLCDRHQYVEVNGDRSGVLRVNHGVPQGSVIGPLLFMVYINDLPNSVGGASTVMFADDTTLYTSHPKVEMAKAGMQGAVEQASNWFTVNKLTLNRAKTQAITLATDRNVPFQNPVTFLGIRIDQRLTWSAHVDQVCSRASSGIFALRRLVGLVNEDVLRMAYFALVHAHLAYGVLLWGASAESRRAFVIQKKALRVMVRKGAREHCRNWFIQLKILTLPCLYIYTTCLHVNKMASSLPTRADVHSYDTRGRNLLVVPASRTLSSENNKVNIKLYNALPNRIKTLTFPRFKSSLKGFLIRSAFYSISEYLGSNIGDVS